MFENEVISSKMSTSSPTRAAPQQQDSRGVTPDGGTVAHTTPSRLKSALSTISSGSGSQLLGVPEGDLRQEQLILGSEEAMVDLRKRDREALSRYNSQLKVRLLLLLECSVRCLVVPTHNLYTGLILILLTECELIQMQPQEVL